MTKREPKQRLQRNLDLPRANGREQRRSSRGTAVARVGEVETKTPSCTIVRNRPPLLPLHLYGAETDCSQGVKRLGNEYRVRSVTHYNAVRDTSVYHTKQCSRGIAPVESIKTKERGRQPKGDKELTNKDHV